MAGVLREMGVDFGVAEMGDVTDDALDDLCGELLGLDLDGGEGDDDKENEVDGIELSNEEDAAAVAARRSATVARHRRAIDERIERMRAEETLEIKLGFTQPVQRRVIELRTQRENDWWLSSKFSRIMFCDDDHADAIVLSHIDQTLSDEPPPTGQGRVFELPKRISEIVFGPWVAWSTTEVVGTNTVATFYTDLLPDLTSVTHRAAPLCLNLRRFAACKATMAKGTILLFCGSAVCTGPKGPAESNAQCQSYVIWLNRLGIPASMQGYRLQNLVSKASAGWEIDLNAIHRKYPFNAQYKPARFPGVIFRFEFEEESVCVDEAATGLTTRKEDQIVAIFFKSSRTILTGSKARAKTRLVWTWIHAHLMREFKKAYANTHTSEAAYRRAVAAEERIIEFTCDTIRLVGEQRGQFDALEKLPESGDAATDEVLRAARVSRKRPYAAVVQSSLLVDDVADEDWTEKMRDRPPTSTPIGAYVQQRTSRELSGEDFVAEWLARNEALIKGEELT